MSVRYTAAETLLRRRFFNLAAALSLAVCVAASVAWALSRERSLKAGWEQFDDGDEFWLKADHVFVFSGRLGFVHFRRVGLAWWSNNRVSRSRGGWFCRADEDDPISAFERHRSRFDVLGFSY